jgi:hypothetical protein
MAETYSNPKRQVLICLSPGRKSIPLSDPLSVVPLPQSPAFLRVARAKRLALLTQCKNLPVSADVHAASLINISSFCASPESAKISFKNLQVSLSRSLTAHLLSS